MDHTSRARAHLVAIAITIVVVIVRSRAIHRAQPPPPERCHAERARGVATHLLHPMADMSRSPRPEYALDPGLTSYVGIFIVVVRARASGCASRAPRGRRCFALFHAGAHRGLIMTVHDPSKGGYTGGWFFRIAMRCDA